MDFYFIVSVPPLDQLYATNTTGCLDVDEIKWEILGWIMSLSESEIKTIRNLKKEFRLISATCAILVKVDSLVKVNPLTFLVLIRLFIFCLFFKQERLLNKIEAGGILCTEYKIYKNKSIETAYPEYLDAQYVRAAHKYNIAFSYVRENFAVAGLLSEIQVKINTNNCNNVPFNLLERFFKNLFCCVHRFQEVLQFDGVYFQTLMAKFNGSNSEKSERFINSVKEYVVVKPDEIQFDLF